MRKSLKDKTLELGEADDADLPAAEAIGFSKSNGFLSKRRCIGMMIKQWVDRLKLQHLPYFLCFKIPTASADLLDLTVWFCKEFDDKKYDLPDSQPPEGHDWWNLTPLRGKTHEVAGEDAEFGADTHDGETHDGNAEWGSDKEDHGDEQIPSSPIYETDVQKQKKWDEWWSSDDCPAWGPWDNKPVRVPCPADEWMADIEATEHLQECHGEEEVPEKDPPIAIEENEAPEEYNGDWMTETATPGSAWEYSPPRPKISHPGDLPRKPRASKRAKRQEDGADLGDGKVGHLTLDAVKWGPVTKTGAAYFIMQAFGQEIDFHDFSLQDLIHFVKTKNDKALECCKDAPAYVQATVSYILELWSTWNTDSVEDVAYWLMEASYPHFSAITSQAPFFNHISCPRWKWNPDLPLPEQTWLNLTKEEARRWSMGKEHPY